MQNVFSISDLDPQPIHKITRNESMSLPLPSTERQNNSDENDSFKVFIRVRPLNSKEIAKNNPKKISNIIKVQDNMIFVMDPDCLAGPSLRRDKSYVFDDVFSEENDNFAVFEKTMPSVLENLLNGYNSTLFAYGMTGAGKTHTLFGELIPENMTRDNSGLIWLSLLNLFSRISSTNDVLDEEYSVKFSYLEIYNEQVRDLLKPSNTGLMIVEDPVKGIFVADLSEYSIASPKEALSLITAGNARRTMAATGANQFSSRSHAIIQVVVERKCAKKGLTQTLIQSKLSLIDLAGSERAAATENRGVRMLEGANINRSLLSLGNCINILSDANKKGAFVPYRDSKLTRLLKDSLGGNTKTAMISCISPSYCCYEETINTLKYANRAKNIQKKVEKNVHEVELHVSQYKEIINNLKEEIENLKLQLRHKGDSEQFVVAKSISELPDATRELSRSKREHSQEPKIRNQNENNLEQTGHQIFEKLEQHWEINQALLELKALESQNKAELERLRSYLLEMQCQQSEGAKSLEMERVKSHIEGLMQTMENNQKIEEDLQATLQRNIEESKKLNDRMVQCVSGLDNAEDVELAKKLMQIESMDLQEQNAEIKKEALQLAKQKMEKNKQILQMEEELKQMRLQLIEKDKMIEKNNILISNLQQQNQHIPQSDKKSLLSSPSSESAYQSSAKPVRFEKKTPADPLASPDTPLRISQMSDPKKEKGERSSDFLKKLLTNLEERIDKSLNEIDQKIQTPVRAALIHKELGKDLKNTFTQSIETGIRGQDSLLRSKNFVSNGFTSSGAQRESRKVVATLEDVHLKEIEYMKNSFGTSSQQAKQKVEGLKLSYSRMNGQNEVQMVSTSPRQFYSDKNFTFPQEESKELEGLPQQETERGKVPSGNNQPNLNSINEISEILKDEVFNSQESGSETDILKEFNQQQKNFYVKEVPKNLPKTAQSNVPKNGPAFKKGANTLKRSSSTRDDLHLRQSADQSTNLQGKGQASHMRNSTSYQAIRALSKAKKENSVKENSKNQRVDGPQLTQPSEKTFSKSVFEGKPIFSKSVQAAEPHYDTKKPGKESLNSNPAQSTNVRIPMFSTNLENLTKLSESQKPVSPTYNSAPHNQNSSKQEEEPALSSRQARMLRANTPDLMAFGKSQELLAANLKQEKRPVMELRGLDEAREALRVFKIRLNALSSIDFSTEKITQNHIEQIRLLVEEQNTRKHVISAKDQDNLARLEIMLLTMSAGPQSQGVVSKNAFAAYSKTPSTRISMNSSKENGQGDPLRRSVNAQIEKRSVSVTQNSKPKFSAASKGVTPTNKEPDFPLNTVEDLVFQKPNPKKETKKTTSILSKGGFSAISSNYAKALNKVMGGGMTKKTIKEQKPPVGNECSNENKRINGIKMTNDAYDNENTNKLRYESKPTAKPKQEAKHFISKPVLSEIISLDDEDLYKQRFATRSTKYSLNSAKASKDWETFNSVQSLGESSQVPFTRSLMTLYEQQ